MRHAGRTPRESDREVAELLEVYVLNLFWALAAKTTDRLGLLRVFTRVQIARDDAWDPQAVRRDHEASVRASTATISKRAGCFACGDEQATLYAHHIIEIQHGGSNAVRNQAPICFECHRYLHPWLTEDPSASRRGGEMTHVAHAAADFIELVRDLCPPVEASR